MKVLRWWPAFRTSSIAMMFFVIAVGMAQFAFSEWSEPCLRIPSPYERLCEWFRGSRRGPLSELLGPQELERLAGRSLCLSLLGLLLVISIRAQRPLRLQLNLRTLMVFVAVLPLGYLGGRDLWLAWERWDGYQHRIERCGNMEEWAQRKYPSETPELAAVKRQAALDSRREKERLQHAFWSPTFWFTLVSRTPQP
jgi:hypothetical protein